jgi:hypothetical protein
MPISKVLYEYETYRESVMAPIIVAMIGDRVYCERYGEDHKPILPGITAGI